MGQERSHLKVRKSNGVSVVEFSERKILEELSINEIRDELLALVSANPGGLTLVSFRNVDYLSSGALGALITLDKAVKEGGGKLRLAEISPEIYDVFKITRLNKLFQIYDTSEQAMASF